MRRVLLAGVIALAPLSACAATPTPAEVNYTSGCIAALLNGYSEEHPRMRLGWASQDDTRSIAESYLVRYGNRMQACKAASAALIELVVGTGLGVH